MKKFKTIIALFLILLLIPATFMGGQLSDFKDELKDSDSSTSSSSSDGSSSTSTDDSDDTALSLLGDILGAILGKPKKAQKSSYTDVTKYAAKIYEKSKNKYKIDKDQPPTKIKFLKYNKFQTYSRYPYQYEGTPFNLHFDLYQKQPANRKKWTLATTIEYQRFDDQLDALVLDLDFTFAGFFKLKVSSNSLQEEMFNYKDSLTLFNFMFGFDLITAKNFIFGSRLGFQKVTDLDLNMVAYDFYMRFFPKKPIVVDLLWTKAIFNEVTTQEFKARLGFLVGMYDFGIGYSWLKLGSASAINAVNFSVRFWM